MMLQAAAIPTLIIRTNKISKFICLTNFVFRKFFAEKFEKLPKVANFFLNFFRLTTTVRELFKTICETITKVKSKLIF